MMQNWIHAPGDPYTNHARAIALMLPRCVDRDWHRGFESALLQTLCVPVILESITNPDIRVESWIFKLLEGHGSPRPVGDENGVPFESMKLHSLAKLPAMFKNPRKQFYEIEFAYEKVRYDLPKLASRVDAIRATFAQLSCPNVEARRLYAQFQAAYGILLTVALVLNSIIGVMRPLDATYARELTSYAEDIMQLADHAQQFRPLGSSFMPLPLCMAWGTTTDIGTQNRLLVLIQAYQTDFHADWVDLCYFSRQWYQGLQQKYSPIGELASV